MNGTEGEIEVRAVFNVVVNEATEIAAGTEGEGIGGEWNELGFLVDLATNMEEINGSGTLVDVLPSACVVSAVVFEHTIGLGACFVESLLRSFFGDLGQFRVSICY